MSLRTFSGPNPSAIRCAFHQLLVHVALLRHLPFPSILFGAGGSQSAAEKVLASVKLYTFNEIDGPRFMKMSSDELEELGVSDRVQKGLLQAIQREQAKKISAVRQTSATQGAATETDWGVSTPADLDRLRDRLAGMLWGVFIGDALSMPAHWYYSVEALRQDYGIIRGYVAPKPQHSTNWIMSAQWKNNKHNVQELIGGNMMNHGKARHWKSEQVCPILLRKCRL
eukprot:SAG31_NODE_7235_length_1747_cov_1.135233_1_plen_226_part_00